MGSEADPDPSPTARLPLFAVPRLASPEPLGMLTPPHYAAASVPFLWEEEPGKPRPFTALIAAVSGQARKCLELPPRLQYFPDPKMTKMPSPTTVLDGPDAGVTGIRSSSCRFRRDRQGSFGSSSDSPERGQLGETVLSRTAGLERAERKLFGSWGRRGSLKSGKKEDNRGSHVFSPSVDFAEFVGGANTTVKVSRIKRNGSFSSLSQVRSRFWATVYEGFKHVLPWKSTRKSKKDGLIL